MVLWWVRMTYICTAARGGNKFKFRELKKRKEYTFPYKRPFRSKLLYGTVWHCSYEKRYPILLPRTCPETKGLMHSRLTHWNISNFFSLFLLLLIATNLLAVSLMFCCVYLPHFFIIDINWYTTFFFVVFPRMYRLTFRSFRKIAKRDY